MSHNVPQVLNVFPSLFLGEERSIFRLLCWGVPPCSKNIGDGPIKWLLLGKKTPKNKIKK
jgi:hypothetical protein